MVVAFIREATITSAFSFTFVAIIYLARAVSKLRERVSRLEGMLENGGFSGRRERT
jgi:hypothetical protein